MNLNIEIIGLLAAALTTSAYVPQVYRVWKTKSVESISLSMYLVMFFGVLLWLIYGIKIESLAVILANIVTSILICSVLYFKIKHK